MDIFSEELRGITAYQKLPWHTATERVLGCSIVKLWLYFSYHLAKLFPAYQGISTKEHTFQLYSTFVFNKWIIAQIRIWSYQQAWRIQNTAMTEEVGNTHAEVVYNNLWDTTDAFLELDQWLILWGMIRELCSF